jgi:hypothetical protein
MIPRNTQTSSTLSSFHSHCILNENYFGKRGKTIEEKIRNFLTRI